LGDRVPENGFPDVSTLPEIMSRGKIFENILGYLWAIQLPFAEKTGEKFQGVKELVQR